MAGSKVATKSCWHAHMALASRLEAASAWLQVIHEKPAEPLPFLSSQILKHATSSESVKQRASHRPTLSRTGVRSVHVVADPSTRNGQEITHAPGRHMRQLPDRVSGFRMETEELCMLCCLRVVITDDFAGSCLLACLRRTRSLSSELSMFISQSGCGWQGRCSRIHSCSPCGVKAVQRIECSSRHQHLSGKPAGQKDELFQSLHVNQVRSGCLEEHQLQFRAPLQQNSSFLSYVFDA